ncbi:MAG: transposon-encoded TnpW family protein, partial [Oscillibacter sp.]|nr:transposon-encoded TnpW family protein [Oscillibacter sp.]
MARDTGADGQGGKQPTPVSRASKRQTHDCPPDLEKKIGKTTYRVWAHFSQTSKETLEDKIKR